MIYVQKNLSITIMRARYFRFSIEFRKVSTEIGVIDVSNVREVVRKNIMPITVLSRDFNIGTVFNKIELIFIFDKIFFN